jgi:uncharacterized membrane protein
MRGPPGSGDPVSTDTDNTAAGIRASRYASCLAASPDDPWDMDRDVFRGRTLDFSRKFLPDGLSLLDRLDFLRQDEALLLSQLQGRTYAATLSLLERVIGATALLQAQGHVLGDPIALESLLRFANDELKHQALFCRLECMMQADMPSGYLVVTAPDAFARAVLGRSAWSLLGLACHVELLTQAHYEQTFAPRDDLCPLYKDVFRFHWHDERRHALLDELEWTSEHANLSGTEREQAVVDFIALLATLSDVLLAQTRADSRYYLQVVGRRFTPLEARHVESTMLAACRWQFIVSGMQHVHFRRLLWSMTTTEQCARIMAALQPIMQA